MLAHRVKICRRSFVDTMLKRTVLHFPAIILAAILLLASGPAAADFASDHPEWFGITTAPLDGVLVGSHHAPQALFLRPSGNDAYTGLLQALENQPLVMLHAGPEDKETIEAFLSDKGLAPAAMSFIDLGELNTALVGDFFPLPVAGAAGMVLVDPRYFPNRQQDDAAGSRLAEHYQACAYRPPLFMGRGFVDTDGNGVCVVSTKIYYANPGLTEQEIDGQLMHFLGCTRIISLQLLQKDGEGRLDTFFRFALPQKAFIGQYEVAQEAANIPILKANREKLEANLPEEAQLVEFPMGTPFEVGSTVLRPSYLTFLLTVDTVVMPVFKADAEYEDEATSLLTQTFATHEIVKLESTGLVQLGTRVTSAVGILPDIDWHAECEPAQIKCDSGSPLECDLCYDECKEDEKICLSSVSKGSCEHGDDDCLDMVKQSCPSDFTCEDGKCKAPPSICDDISEYGACDGEVAIKCVGGQVIKVDCAKDNLFCSINEEGFAACIVPCFVSCTVGESVCSDDGASLVTCTLDADNCPMEDSAACMEGEFCVDGACTATSSDVVEQPDSDSPADQGGGTGDTADFGAGYGGSGDGCGFGLEARGSRGLVLLALMAAAALCLLPVSRRRRKRGDEL